MHVFHLTTPTRAALTALLLLAIAGSLLPPPAAAADEPPAADVPPALAGETWREHLTDDLLPYWDMPEAYGDPVGNFPSARGRAGELLPGSPNRVLSTLGRGVYGYSVSFLLTGDERYLTLARAGLDWVEAHAVDEVNGGYFGELDSTGQPVAPTANKDLFDLASVGMGYAAYFNATRDPDAEQHLLAIRDLIFSTYYDAATRRFKDTVTFDLATEVDTGSNGGDITNVLVPGVGMYLPTIGLLSDPGRRRQFRDDLRLITQNLIDRHKNSAATANQWMFWGRTARFGRFNALQTDFGHNLKSYGLVTNANQQFADRPWDGLAADRATLLDRAWDAPAARWNDDLRSFTPGDVDPDSGWWIHDEADQLLAAVDLATGFAEADRLALSAQRFLDVYVDRDPAFPPETWSRVLRTDPPGQPTGNSKSFPGKNMDHNFEHALVLYLHGQQLQGEAAELHYAFPADQALTAVARPYWFDATGQSRQVDGPSTALPGHELVTVDFTGIGQVPRPPYPAPDDTTAPVTTATTTPEPSAAGWHSGDVTVDLTATDDLAGVKEIHVRVQDPSGASRTASIHPGDHVPLPPLTDEGEHIVTFFAVDTLGNTEEPQTLTVRIDRTAPTVSGLPGDDCVLWPPNGRLVRIAEVAGADEGSGVADVSVRVAVNQPADGDVEILGDAVWVRAERSGGRDRVYTVHGTTTDRAGNATTESRSCVVPRSP